MKEENLFLKELDLLFLMQEMLAIIWQKIEEVFSRIPQALIYHRETYLELQNCIEIVK